MLLENIWEREDSPPRQLIFILCSQAQRFQSSHFGSVIWVNVSASTPLTGIQG